MHHQIRDDVRLTKEQLNRFLNVKYEFENDFLEKYIINQKKIIRQHF